MRRLKFSKSHASDVRRYRLSFVLLAFCVGCASTTSNRAGVSNESTDESRPNANHETVSRFVDRHCSLCHGEKLQEADLNLVALAKSSVAIENHSTWATVFDMLRGGNMPPAERPRPRPEHLQEILGLLDADLEHVAQSIEPDPGRVTTRRLNRAEYRNTIRDLLGVEFEAEKNFPADDSGYGFDTIGDVLSVSPLLMEKYFSAAERIAAKAVGLESVEEDDDAEKYARIFVCGHERGGHTAACARKVLRPLAYMAYRRPVTRKETQALVSFVEMVEEDGGSFEEGIRLALEAILVSPHFVFRVERDRAPTDPSAAHYVTDFELATRLSYFLWSSMPDEELLRRAESGSLRDSAVLEAEIQRMLADEKSQGLVSNFAGQWLQLRNLPLAYRDRETFPEFNDQLKRAMGEETRLFFTEIMKEDRSVLDFLDADYTYLNDRLAEHYGIEGVEGEHFRRVTVDRDERGGLLTHGSILTLTAYPTRTSPVLRGLWILENVLGAPPPPPPPDVPPLGAQPIDLQLTMRERMEQHRADPTCASCHARMDPLGFGLENYDAIGRWRSTLGDTPIDSSGALPTGETFRGPRELKALLMERKDQFVRTLTEKMLTYALGRGLEFYDRSAVDGIARAVAENEYRFSHLVTAVAMSMPFQMRRGEEGGEA